MEQPIERHPGGAWDVQRCCWDSVVRRGRFANCSYSKKPLTEASRAAGVGSEVLRLGSTDAAQRSRHGSHRTYRPRAVRLSTPRVISAFRAAVQVCRSLANKR
jgi:hypothetical protein